MQTVAERIAQRINLPPFEQKFSALLYDCFEGAAGVDVEIGKECF